MTFPSRIGSRPFWLASVLLLFVWRSIGVAAADHYGQVTVAGVPVPGATITASRAGKQLVTSTDQQGVYKLADTDDGVWTIRVEMLGFTTISQDVTLAADTPPATFELKLRPFDELAKDVTMQAAEPPRPAAAAPATARGAQNGSAKAPTPPAGLAAPRGFQRAGVNASTPPPAAATPPPAESAGGAGGGGGESSLGAADGLLINGSVNNGAASPFAQLAAFGNNRRGLRSLYNGGVAAVLGSSMWDSRPVSFTNQDTSKPDYTDIQIMGQVGGPLRIPGLIKNGGNMFVGYQRTSDHSAITQPAVVPTALERLGDFSQSLNGFGQPVRVVDPISGQPFSGTAIPRDRLSPQALALLNYYPLPNLAGGGRYNFQAPLVNINRQDAVQARLNAPPFGRNQYFGNIAIQRTSTETSNIFGFNDATTVSGVDGAVNWSRRFSQFFTLRARYQFTALSTDVVPYFANRANVSGDAGIKGNNQDPVNWGPPALTFADGIESLNTAQYSSTTNHTHVWSGESLWSHNRHNVTFGGGVHRLNVDVLAQQNARGGFSFTGATTGSDLADFLLGLPRATTIAFGNADKYLRANSYEAYVTDDWRVNPGLTINAGVRWEYEAPFTERYGRLVNLDVTPGFTAVSPIVATSPSGALTGTRYPESLLRPDRLGIQPRLGLSWRPIAGSSIVVRGGYGVYRNTNVYQSIALLMAQQPPLSTAFNVQSSAANPLSLANGFVTPVGTTPSTFAVDPDFRVGYAENWQASVQRDLPASLTVITTYLGTRGSHLMQEFLPNTYPAGAVNPCPACPSGFAYLTSNGRSSRHAGQVQVRRRLRNGMTATVQYTLAKANDDAGAFSGVGVNGVAIAQDWLNLEGEYGPSNFDQRHLVTAQVQYSTGVGVAGGTLVDGLRGALWKGWTITADLKTGSGLPLTPVYLAAVSAGVTGTVRPDLTGASMDAPDGYYLNPAAFAAPQPGRWGTAGRNSITGPAQFTLNMGITRSFPWRDRLNLDWRIDASNLLNRVTYSGANTVFGSPQFGLPNRANTMRKVTSTLRLRF